MAKIYGTEVAKCPHCHKPIGNEHPYTWCSACGESLPNEIADLIPWLQKHTRKKPLMPLQDDHTKQLKQNEGMNVEKCPHCSEPIRNEHLWWCSERRETLSEGQLLGLSLHGYIKNAQRNEIRGEDDRRKCPLCNVSHPSSAQRCDCGYVFLPGNEAADAAFAHKLTIRYNRTLMLEGAFVAALGTVSLPFLLFEPEPSRLLGFSTIAALMGGIIAFLYGFLGWIFGKRGGWRPIK